MIHFTNINGERLPEDVNKIANERWEKEIKPNSNNELRLTAGFAFSITPEKLTIWYEVYQGNYEPLREFHNL